MVALLGKHGLSTVDITFALVEWLAGNELDAIHKFKIGKAAKGNVAEKRAAVATSGGRSDDTGWRARAAAATHPLCLLVYITIVTFQAVIP